MHSALAHQPRTEGAQHDARAAVHEVQDRTGKRDEKIHGRRHRQRHMLTTRQRQRFGHDLAQDHLKISDQREGDHRGGDVGINHGMWHAHHHRLDEPGHRGLA